MKKCRCSIVSSIHMSFVSMFHTRTVAEVYGVYQSFLTLLVGDVWSGWDSRVVPIGFTYELPLFHEPHLSSTIITHLMIQISTTV